MSIKKKDKKNSSVRTSQNFIIALALVSVIGFAEIVLDSLFFIDLSGYIDALWLFVLGAGLILEASLKDLKQVKVNGLTSESLGEITMIIVGSIAAIAGILSIPQINLQNPSFLAVKGIISLIAIILVILQTWVIKKDL